MGFYYLCGFSEQTKKAPGVRMWATPSYSDSFWDGQSTAWCRIACFCPVHQESTVGQRERWGWGGDVPFKLEHKHPLISWEAAEAQIDEQLAWDHTACDKLGHICTLISQISEPVPVLNSGLNFSLLNECPLVNYLVILTLKDIFLQIPVATPLGWDGLSGIKEWW